MFPFIFATGRCFYFWALCYSMHHFCFYELFLVNIIQQHIWLQFSLCFSSNDFLQSSKILHMHFNPLSANITKWSNTLKQFVGLKTKTSLQSGTKCLYEKKNIPPKQDPSFTKVESLLGRKFIFIETDFDFSIEFCLADAFTLPGCLFSNINYPLTQSWRQYRKTRYSCQLFTHLNSAALLAIHLRPFTCIPLPPFNYVQSWYQRGKADLTNRQIPSALQKSKKHQVAIKWKT